MRTSNFSIALLVGVVLGGSAAAQQAYGSWVHDNAAKKMAVYVSLSGNDLSSGESPATAKRTLQAALQAADKLLASNWAVLHKGVTINVAPGTYTQVTPLLVPAFGIRIEAYKDVAQPNAIVNIVGSGPFPNQGLIQFDRHFGPLAAPQLMGQNPPPSVLRGLQITGNSVGIGGGGGAAVWIDPTINGTPSDFAPNPIAVEVNQCALLSSNDGVRIQNIGQAKITYACQIIDNEITLCDFGIRTFSSWDESNLLRSNRVHRCRTGMQLNAGATFAGQVWPRVLSNAVYDIVGDPNFVYPQFGIAIRGGSAQVVNNTVAFVTGSSINPAQTASLYYDNPSSPPAAGQTLVVANNFLYSPTFTIPFTTTNINPNELILPAGFAGTATIRSNVYDSLDPIPAPFLSSPTNVGTTTPKFANMVAPYDVHVVPPSPAVTNVGDPSFVLPSATTTIVINGVSFLANCALDMDLDARTNQTLTSSTPVLHRGADQMTWDGIRLSAPTTGTGLPQNYANAIGKAVPDSSGRTKVWLQIGGPQGSFYITYLCSTLPMGPEVEQVVTPFGSLAIDSAPANAVQIGSGTLGAAPTQTLFDMGFVSPTFLEAEMYLQTIVFRPNGGPVSLSNRIRLDVDKN